MAKKKEEKSIPAVARRSMVKEHIKNLGLNTAGNLYEAVDAKVVEMLDRASARATANGRKTVRDADL
jgi:histone H3/H4